MAPPQIPGSVVAVTGGAGFIGRHLVRALLAGGAAEVRVLDRVAPEPDDRVRHLAVDLAAVDSVEIQALLEGASGVFHLGAEKHAEAHARPADILRVNVLGTHAVLEGARRAGVEKVVFASSLYAYGRTSGPPLVESEATAPTTVYGISKLAGEHLGASIARAGGPAFVALRYFFVYGEEQNALHGRPSLFVRTLRGLLRGEAPVIRGDGAQALDYVHVSDVVRATLAAMERDVPDRVLNVGSGVALTVTELVAALQRAAGTALPPGHEPADATQGTRRVASLDRVTAVLGFRPELTLDQGLARTLAWLRTTPPG